MFIVTPLSSKPCSAFCINGVVVKCLASYLPGTGDAVIKKAAPSG